MKCGSGIMGSMRGSLVRRSGDGGGSRGWGSGIFGAMGVLGESMLDCISDVGFMLGADRFADRRSRSRSVWML
jgi:hypothetical protein